MITNGTLVADERGCWRALGRLELASARRALGLSQLMLKGAIGGGSGITVAGQAELAGIVFARRGDAVGTLGGTVNESVEAGQEGTSEQGFRAPTTLEACWRRVPTTALVDDGAQVAGDQFAAFLAGFAENLVETLEAVGVLLRLLLA